ncbi:MAG: hypothetical protein WAK20_03530 [Candidatus Acidiferrum sp.]
MTQLGSVRRVPFLLFSALGNGGSCRLRGALQPAIPLVQRTAHDISQNPVCESINIVHATLACPTLEARYT